MKKSEQVVQTKSSAKATGKSKKPYTTPKLKVLGKLDRMTAGSGAGRSVCIMP